MDREVRRALIAFFPGIEEHLGHTEDSTRWHALGARYFHFLDIDDWVADWCRANRELATRVGLLDGARTRPRRRR